MKSSPVLIQVAAMCFLISAWSLHAQGMITFNDASLGSGLANFSLSYFEGISFRVQPAPPQPHDNIWHVGADRAGHPGNGTAHVEFINALGVPQYAAFAWTAAALSGQSFTNGAPFGLVSVDLADPVAPSLTPVDITFIGFKWNGSMVSQTFTMGGGGSTAFQTYQFNTDFALGLTRVEIPSAAWAMDNLVWIPEPGSATLVLFGLLVWFSRRRTDRQWLP